MLNFILFLAKKKLLLVYFYLFIIYIYKYIYCSSCWTPTIFGSYAATIEELNPRPWEQTIALTTWPIPNGLLLVYF